MTDQRRTVLAAACCATLLLAGAACGSAAAPSPDSSADSSSSASSRPAEVTESPSEPRLTADGRATPPPWPASLDPQGRVATAGLPMLGEEGQVEHIHVHLDVLVDGRPVTVPANIGIDLTAQQISPLHTHDTSGVVHVESPVKVPFSLGQFMTEWDVALTADSIGGLKAEGGKQLVAYVNGKRYSGNPAGIIFQAHQEIALVYGTAAQQADPPSGYEWPEGL